jgi:hypothetical protein
MKSQASEALDPESLQSQNRLHQKIESPIKPLGVLHGRLAKPSQALTLVLAAVPEGWKAEVVPAVLSEKQQRLFEEVNLKPGDVYRLTSE